MNHVEATKTVVKLGGSVAIGATHTHEIDTLGYSYASIDVIYSNFTAAAGATAAAAVLKLQQSDTSGSGQEDVTGLVGGTNFTAGPAVTSGSLSVGYSHRFDVDLRGKKRYLSLVTTPVSAVTINTVARLGKAEAGPVNATGKGVSSAASG